MKKLFLASVVVLTSLIFTGALAVNGNNSFVNDYSGKVIEKQFNVKYGGTLTLDMKTGGDITIESWDKEVLTVKATIRGMDADYVDVDFNQLSDGVEISTDYSGHSRHHNTDVDFVLKVPNKYSVDFSTMGGDVSIKGVEGKIDGKTMGGRLDLSGLKGKLDVTTMGGSISLTDSDVDGKVLTMGGAVNVENVTGDVDAKSMGGKITQKNVKGRNGKSIGSEVNITTMGGDIDIDEAPNGANLKTMGGDVSINKAGKFVNAETMGGDIDIKSVDGWVKAKTMGGDVEVNVVGNGNVSDKDVTLTSMGGDVVLTVPANMSMSVDIEIAYTKNNSWFGHGKKPKIESDFSLNLDESKDWEYRHGSARKYIYGKAEINGGKNKVMIKTINGNVYLKKD